MNTERFSEEDFNGFLLELINGHKFSTSKEEGIAKLVLDKGFEALSVKQKFVFEKELSHYVYDECSRCGDYIPWCEMSGAEDNGGMCGWCQQLSLHDD